MAQVAPKQTHTWKQKASRREAACRATRLRFMVALNSSVCRSAPSVSTITRSSDSKEGSSNLSASSSTKNRSLANPAARSALFCSRSCRAASVPGIIKVTSCKASPPDRTHPQPARGSNHHVRPPGQCTGLLLHIKAAHHDSVLHDCH